MPTQDGGVRVPPIRLEYHNWDDWYDEMEQLRLGHLPMIIFDLDGTLLDSHDLSIESHRQVVKRLGLPPVSHDMLAALNGPTSEQAVQMLGLPVSRVPEFDAHMRDVDNVLVRQHARLFPGVPEMLDKLQGKATLALLTNGSPHYVEESANATGIKGFFDLIQGFVPGMGKAKRLRSWYERFLPAGMMMVGDRASDIDAAHEAGAIGVGVLYGAGSLPELSSAEMIARDMDELRRICLAFCER